jgi:electron transfer flavoprotein beta subunit
MAMGADSGILLCDSAFAGSDTLATSSALAGAIQKLAPFDLILFGDRSSDSDTGQVGPQTSVHLDLPLVTNVHSLEPKGDYLLVKRKVDGFLESYKVSFPAAFTINIGAVQPRDVGLLDIKLAYNDKDVKYWDLSDLGLSSDCVGRAGSATSLLTFSRMESTRKCEFLSGLAEEQAEEIVFRMSELGII